MKDYQGPSRFGPAYQYMYEHDSHAPGSVDCVLLEQMVQICPETVERLYRDFTPLELRYAPGSRPILEQYVPPATGAPEDRIDLIAGFTSHLADGTAFDLDTFILGGTEEEIIARGTDWCTDLARVGCVLFQMAGLPARIAILADTALAYSGHVITEVFREGHWGAVDTTVGTVYRDLKGRPVSVAELTAQPDPGQFRAAALANYFVWDAAAFDYTTSNVNEYGRSILTLSVQGWPGGLRWLHGEEKRTPTAR